MLKQDFYHHLIAQRILLALIYLKWLDDLLSSTPGYSSNTTGKGSGISTATQQQKELYTYDAVGNRLTSDKYSAYSYNAANQLISNGGVYTYDANGNLTKKTETDDGKTKTTTYSYDYENRLTKVIKQESNETKTVSFKYDPFGRRIEKKVEETEKGKTETTTTKYIYDNEDIVLEYDENRIIGNSYIHGPGIDEPLAVLTNQGTYYYHADGLGSIVALTDSNGKTQQTYEYDSFGNLKDQKNKIKQPYTYTGREWDKEIGAYFNRARYYDPKIGRFLSFDPILHPGNGAPAKSCSQTISYPSFEGLKTNPQKFNPFVYVQNRPTVLTDPSGFGPPSECSFYQDLCCQGDSYACQAYKACKVFGDNKVWNCIRNCLIDAYKECQTAQCVIGDHEVCWSVCFYKGVVE
ncbi:MAG: hypothetical protein HY265_07110 [Deltaproteobacteria bacterium]|nr:hypothetical protein [Deltaproteobacteria bacterium]